MTRGIWALWERALRIDSRTVTTHLVRVSVLGLVYAELLIAVNAGSRFGAPGLQFITWLAFANVVVITIVGARLFGSTLTEEKEEGTLPLLILTGMDPLVVLLGKASSRLLQMLLLLCVQVPAALFAVTLGGVTLSQVVAALVSLAAYLVCISNIGLLASVLAKRTGDAAGAVVIFALLYGIVPPMAGQFASGLQRYGSEWIPTSLQPALIILLRFLSEQSVYGRLNEVLATGFTGGPLCWQVASNTLAGVGAFGLSWCVYPWATSNLESEGTSRRLVGIAPAQQRGSWRSPGRVWSNGPAWLAFQFDAGGFVGIGIKLLIGFCVCLLSTWLMTDQFRRSIRFVDLITNWAGILTLLLIFEAIIHAGRLFQNEYRQGTWSTLLTLPRSIAYLGYSKAGGILLSMLPGIIVCLLLWSIVWLNWRRIGPFFFDGSFACVVIWWIIHYVAWLSTYRHQSQALLRLLGSGIGLVLLILVIASTDWRGIRISEGTLVTIISVGLLASILPMHWSMGIQLSKDEIGTS